METLFIDGAIPPEFIANSIAKYQSKHTIGAHHIFLGQVRADVIEGKQVTAIAFTNYKEMALNTCQQIKDRACQKFNLDYIHIYHSEGIVKAGELCFFVFVAAAHSKTIYAATEYLVKAIKTKVPIFGKEIFEDQTHQWKVNT